MNLPFRNLPMVSELKILYRMHGNLCMFAFPIEAPGSISHLTPSYEGHFNNGTGINFLNWAAGMNFYHPLTVRVEGPGRASMFQNDFQGFHCRWPSKREN